MRTATWDFSELDEAARLTRQVLQSAAEPAPRPPPLAAPSAARSPARGGASRPPPPPPLRTAGAPREPVSSPPRPPRPPPPPAPRAPQEPPAPSRRPTRPPTPVVLVARQASEARAPGDVLSARNIAEPGSGAPDHCADPGAHGAQTGSPAPGSPADSAAPRDPAAPLDPERTERLVQALSSMCQRGGFNGAALVDALGRPLAEHQSTLSTQLVCEVATALGATVERAGRLLQQPQVNRVALDIEVADKAVLRRFEAGARPFSLLVICPRAVDERSEVGLSVGGLRKILSGE